MPTHATEHEPVIRRDIDAAAQQRFDLIVVGGGIHGVMITLEAARRGLRPLLVERRDFGGAASWNSLRIVHGGLRYLQSMDLVRFQESVRERRWYFQHLPEQVRPLRCLLPLYGKGLKRTNTFGVALRLNDFLARRRNVGVPPDRHIGGGRIIDPRETQRLFPLVDADGLQGAGLWHDGVMVSPQRLLMELLRWAAACGATALNYLEARDLLIEGGAVAGVEALDAVTGRTVRLRAPRVINAAGLWCDELARRWRATSADLTHPSLAFNVMLDRPPIADAAVAVTPKRPGAPTYFLVPWGTRLFAGTVHLPFNDRPTDPQPPTESVHAFLEDLNLAVPGLGLTPQHVLRLYPGLLPATAAGVSHTLHRPVIVNHAKHGGPAGVTTVCGIKYTTAHLVAEQTLRAALGPSLPPPRGTPRPAPAADLDFENFRDDMPAAAVRHLVEYESVVDPDDLFLRRTDWGVDPRRLPAQRDWLHAILAPRQPQLAAPGARA